MNFTIHLKSLLNLYGTYINVNDFPFVLMNIPKSFVVEHHVIEDLLLNNAEQKVRKEKFYCYQKLRIVCDFSFWRFRSPPLPSPKENKSYERDLQELVNKAERFRIKEVQLLKKCSGIRKTHQTIIWFGPNNITVK